MKLLVISGIGSGIGYEMSKKFKDEYFILGISKFTDNKKKFNHIDHKIKIDINNHKKLKEKINIFIFKYEKEITEINFLFCAAKIGNGSTTLNSNLIDWQKIFSTNVISNLFILKIFRIFIGKVPINTVFFSGGGAAYEYPIFPAYAISKVSIVKLVENLEEDFKHYKNFITIALSPGSQKTNMQKIVKKFGGEIKTKSNMSKLFKFLESFFELRNKNISGRFIHVNQNIKGFKKLDKNLFKLRRLE